MARTRTNRSRINKNIIEENINQVLKTSGMDYKKDVIVGGVPSDYFVLRPTGGTVLFEVKQWEPTIDNLLRARNISNHMTSGSGVDNTYIVMPYLPADASDPYIITPNKIINVLNNPVVTSSKNIPLIVHDKPIKKVFVAMPISKEYDDTYYVGIQPVVTKLNFNCIRVDQEPILGDINVNIKQIIKESDFVIADVSESNPNVLYEMGYAEGVKLKVFQICSTSIENLPFDIRNNKTILYNIGQTNELAKELYRFLHQSITNEGYK